MSDLSKVEEFSLEKSMKELEAQHSLCQMLLKTPHYQKMGADGIFAIIAKAKALNVNPLDALNGGLYYVNGKVGMSTELMVDLIRRAGHSVKKDPKSDNSICILHGKRADTEDTWTVSFSIDDAKRAGIYKNVWEKYPGVMAYNRAMSMLARQLFADVIKGAAYTQEELDEISYSKVKSVDFVKTPTSNRETKSEDIEMEVSQSKNDETQNDWNAKSEIISEQEAEYLENLLNQVPEYKKIVMDHLAKSGIATLYSITKEQLEKIRMKAIEIGKAKEEGKNASKP